MFGSGNRYPSLKKITILFLLIGGFLFAQEQKGGGSLPLFEKKSPNYGLLIPEEKIEDFSFLSKPKPDNPSLMDKETFINPGDKYLKRLKKDSPISSTTYLGDTYLGDVHTTTTVAQIVCRDFEYEDGDRVRILVNDEEVIPNLLLLNQFFSLNLPLANGFNKIDFQALNQGSSGPNTAELRVFDKDGLPLVSHQWNLSTGSTATLIIVKEGDILSKN